MASILDVRKGDIIVERANGKKSMIPVRKVEFFVCSSRGVHVNDNACYDNTAVVTLVDGKGTIVDLQEAIEEGTDANDEIDAEIDREGVTDDELEKLADLLVKH